VSDRFELGIIRQEKLQKLFSLKDEDLLSQEDYDSLLSVVSNAGDSRAKAMFEAMYYSGMRVSEMLQLRMKVEIRK
jgi:integrase/recombinase XerD